jgi:antitoxin ParD1/3/4
MNISLPNSLKSFVDEQVSQRGFSTSSEYMRELIRKDLDRTTLREMLLSGAGSEAVGHFDANYFEGLRKSIQHKG